MAIGAGIAMMATGCSGPAQSSPPSPTATATQTVPPSPTPTPTPMEIAPLRGTEVPAGSLDHASIAAKIDNQILARPQVGLESADIVFEELVEGGITRYLAIWHSSIPEELGPVRSIRPMDPLIISPFGGIMCYSGGQHRFLVLIQAAPVYNCVHGAADTASVFYRTKSKAAPHNVILKAQDLLALHPDLKAPKQQFDYSADLSSSSAVVSGTETQKLSFVFSTTSKPSWTYDSGRQLFLRDQRGVKDVDSEGAQLTATNVIALRVGITNLAGNVPKTELVGGGEAWVSAGGSTVHGKWTKASSGDTIHLVDESGSPIELAPGNTWIELVPTAGSVAFSPPAS